MYVYNKCLICILIVQWYLETVAVRLKARKGVDPEGLKVGRLTKGIKPDHMSGMNFFSSN